ncbi:polysaccharide lyase [Vreelandella hamiltonii]|uniref:Polysaccharide lyase 14 domain-containing protein n=1 Tax=Vreelandella hamiltonii TaxID=502829 RepID=A0A8H9I4U2_9GAMM|nr:hypothetical protein [Halomonas hamiltonii]GGW38338.1 hypothetical protein GCM10007157_31850 [Halomonas hamiltonii]
MIRFWTLGLTLVVLFALWWSGIQAPPTSEQAIETFDNPTFSSQGQSLVEHSRTQLAPGHGVNGSTALRVDYEGYERGSRRVVVSPRIDPALQYELSFWVQFCEGFDFARGGKLHGLGPASPVAGGNEPSADQWSARLMFRGDGGLQTYVYHQDMAGRYGDTRRAEAFQFTPGQYHHVRMQVDLNAPSSANNGQVLVWVDDALVIEHTGLRFRDVENDQSLIQRLMFSTFHGGSSPEWAPRDSTGAFKTDCAFFDDFSMLIK